MFSLPFPFIKIYFPACSRRNAPEHLARCVALVRLLRSSINVFFNTLILNFPSIFVGIDLYPFGVIMRTHLRVDMFPGSDSGHRGVEKERLAG